MFLTAIEAYRERYTGTIQLLSNLRVGPFLKWELKPEVKYTQEMITSESQEHLVDIKA